MKPLTELMLTRMDGWMSLNDLTAIRGGARVCSGRNGPLETLIRDGYVECRDGLYRRTAAGDALVGHTRVSTNPFDWRNYARP